MNYKAISLTVSILVISFAIVFYALGWTEPTVTPPGGNVATPINEGSVGQVKSGPLRLGGLTVDSNTYLATGSGNVGIGTTSPAEKLHVAGAIRADTGYRIYKDGSDTIAAGPYYYLANSLNNRAWSTQLGADNDMDFWSYDGGSWARKVTFQQNGNVGIGTTSPGAKLEVAGQIKITGGSPGANKVLTSNASGLASWQTPSAFSESDTLQTVTGRGTTTNLTITTAGLALNGSGNEGNISTLNQLIGYNDLFLKGNSAETASIYYGGSIHRFYTASIERLTILNNGNVGIGTTSPSEKLDVVGNIVASGTICDSTGCISSGEGLSMEIAYTTATVSSPYIGFASYTLDIQSSPPITTSGGLVSLDFAAWLAADHSGTVGDGYYLKIYRDSTEIYSRQSSGTDGVFFEYSSFMVIDNPPAGTYTYHVKLFKNPSGVDTMHAKNRALRVIVK